MTQSTLSHSWPAAAATVPEARRLVRDHLLERGELELMDNAALLTSELVANVVLHVGGTVDVSVTVRPGAVLIDITDESSALPQVRTFSAGALTGRGLRLVQALSADCGVRHNRAGKTVWVHLTAASATRAETVLAESFADVDWLGSLEERFDPDAEDDTTAPGSATSSPFGREVA